jgi:HEAT repeat protein
VRELANAPAPRRRAIVSILARRPDAETLERLCRLLPDPEIGEYTLNALRGEADHLGADEGDALRGVVAGLLKDRGFLADAEGTGRALRLLGYLRSPKSLRTIVAFAADKHPLPVRLAALAALRRPLAAAGGAEAALELLLDCADDPDATVARAAVDTLRGLRLPDDAATAKRLLALSTGRHAETRKLALEALGRSGGGGGKALKSLIAALGGDDPTAREAAAASLARLEGAGPALVKELEGLGNLDGAGLEHLRLLCRLIRRHPDALGPAARESVGGLARAALERCAPAAEALLELYAGIDSAGYARLLGELAAAHRKAKRFEQAFALGMRLHAQGLLDDEGRYAAAVAGLCALASKKELGRASRTTDPVLKLIVELIAHGEPVAKKLTREKGLDPEGLFYVGFNFVESRDEEEKDFGATLLAHLAETAPRSKLGKSAKNKLHLAGAE